MLPAPDTHMLLIILLLSGQEEVRHLILPADVIENQIQLCFSPDQTLQQQMNTRDFTTGGIRPVHRHIRYQDPTLKNHRQYISVKTCFRI